MWPLSCKEIQSETDNIVQVLINQLNNKKTLQQIILKPLSQHEIYTQIISGGYPEAIKIKDPKLRGYWFSSYISTYIERDVRDIGEIRHLSNFIKLFNLLAANSANIFNIKNLSKNSGITETTVKNYLGLLKMVFQIVELPSFQSNISKRFIKSPKTYHTDTGVLSHLLNIQTVEDLYTSINKGQVIETFVFCELNKHIAYLGENIQLYHYRTNDQKEIDFILEYKQQLIAIEVKASSKVNKSDFKHIIDLQNKSQKLSLGIVFYFGDKLLSLGNNLYAIPFSFFF